ncbi:MAG: UDP-N-acetylmuramate dehydrogenase [Thermotogaceae bacterium]|nr:UDP-N-acetylmuramate dehydrogenase [Thermotogaceae bacterium]
MNEVLDMLYISGCDVFPKEPMKYHTSIKIGGKVTALVYPNTIESFKNAVNILRKYEKPFKIKGMGTNLLVSDDNLSFFVLSTERLTGIDVSGEVITTESGVPLKRLIEIAAKNSLSGMEELFGIPGSVGGAVFMNAGAYGREIKDVLLWAEVFDGEKVEKLSAKELGLEYRGSNVGDRIILRAAFEFKKSYKDRIIFHMKEILKKRLDKQPIYEWSAGSLFKRPKPDFYVGSTLEKLGFKGYKVGCVKISEKHAGFMINEGCGTFEDAMKLIEIVKSKVRENYNVELEPEVVIWR